MGSSPKSLSRLIDLTETGALKPGARICDIGATQLFGDGDQKASRKFLSYYAGKAPSAKRPDEVDPAALAAIADNGFLGDLLILAGFEYTALDIFHATNTILFDLNVHEPGPALAGAFDLVMNFGTTEHVFNQLRAFQTIHALTKVGGLTYHDLPMSGYVDHALYRYDPLFFRTVLPANGYEVLLQAVSVGREHPVPADLREMGYRVPAFTDVGIEVVCRRTGPEPFRIPMETTTSLSVDPEFERVAETDFVRMAENVSVHYGVAHGYGELSAAQLSRMLAARIWNGGKRRLLRYFS